MKSYARNVKTVKNENRALIFHYVRQKPISRADISKLSGMSKSAVTMITNHLIEEGQLIEIGTTESSYGRKPILLDIVPDYKYAAGISIHRHHTYMCLVDLKFNILSYTCCRTDRWNDPYQLLDFAYETLEGFFQEHHLTADKLIGIGVSAPGPLDYISGKILNPPDFELFHSVEVGAYLKKKSNLPVMVDNNSVLLAMQEYVTQESSRYQNFMYITSSDGVGSAIVTDGKIYRGFGGFAGEIGHISIHPDGVPCPCGNIGCLERYISLKALKERFDFDSYELLVDNAYRGDMESKNVIAYIAEEFSHAIVNAINMFDLDAVIISGELAYRPQELLEQIRKIIEKRTVIIRNHRVDIQISSLSTDLACASVCAAVVNRYFEQQT